MFAPTRTWRRWHRKVNINQKRYAVASAIAASAVTALVLARGHRISQIPEVPLVVKTDTVESLTKTKNALALLTKLHANPDVERCHKVTRHSGKARLRNRAKKIKVGPLIITGNKGATAYRAFRNLAGVQVSSVHDLDLLKLAPGGQLGRFIIWTQAAFEQLNTIFGTFDKPSLVKKGYFLPRPILANPDVRRVVQADTILAVAGPRKEKFVRKQKPNYLKNSRAMHRLNPYVRYEKIGAAHVLRKALKAKAGPKKTIAKEGKKEKKEKATTVKTLFAKFRSLIHGDK